VVRDLLVLLGMGGQVPYHLMVQAGETRAPWGITTVVSCLPVLVLGMGTALAHMLRGDATAEDQQDSRSPGPASERSADRPAGDRPADQPDYEAGTKTTTRTGRPPGTGGPVADRSPAAPAGTKRPVPNPAHSQKEMALRVARELADAGKPVSRRALRDGGVKGSNQALNTLARTINAGLLNEATALS
jgi:hypothetical protein